MSEETQTAAATAEPQPPASPASQGKEGALLDGQGSEKSSTWKDQLKRPAVVAAIILGLGVVGLVAWLESGSVYVDLDPVVERELMTNLGLTEGVPVAIKINQATVFMINEPGGSARTNEVMDNVKAAIESLKQKEGRTVTLDLDSSDLPAIIQTKVDGSERQVIVQLTQEDLTLAGVEDPKFLARVWAERLTDAFKLFIFGEAPEFTEGTPYGEALRAMYSAALVERGAISNGALENAYDELQESERAALATFPEDMQPDEPVVQSEAPPVLIR